MKNFAIIFGIFLATIFIFVLYYSAITHKSLFEKLVQTHAPIVNEPTISQDQNSDTVSPTSSQLVFHIYLIDINDNGKKGDKVGCGDSVVPIERAVVAGTPDIEVALKDLLALKGQHFGDSNYYNALYQSNLDVKDVQTSGDNVTVHLTGTYRAGGVCDDPRIAAQLTKTALQFGNVKNVEIFINDKPLKSFSSQK